MEEGGVPELRTGRGTALEIKITAHADPNADGPDAEGTLVPERHSLPLSRLRIGGIKAFLFPTVTTAQ